MTEKKQIILLDLNSTLCERPRPIWNRRDGIEFESETYRQWLVDLLKNHYVALFTVRHSFYQEKTLANIQKKTGWQPQDAFFRWFKEPGGDQAANAKEKMLFEGVYPKYSTEKHCFFALESNQSTHAMFNRNNIPWEKVYPDTRWAELPPLKKISL